MEADEVKSSNPGAKYIKNRYFTFNFIKINVFEKTRLSVDIGRILKNIGNTGHMYLGK